MADARQAIEILNGTAADDVLGFFVWWGTWEAMVAPSALRAIFDGEGLPSSHHVPADPTPSQAFRRAVNYGVSGQTGITYKLIADDHSEITYGLREDVVDKEAVRAPARQFARVTWLPGLNKIVSDRSDHPVVQRIVSVLPMFRDNFVSDDVRKAIKSALSEANAVPVAGRGGTSCFVPYFAADIVGSLERAVALIPNRNGETAASLRENGQTGGQTFVPGPVPNGEKWRQIGEKAGRSEFTSRVESAVADLADFQARTEAHLEAIHESDSGGEEYAGTGPRVSSLASRLTEYKELRDKIESYSAALSFRAEDMLAKLDAVKATVSEMLGD